MSADVVNLRRARKAKRRADDDTEAAARRARFGRTGSERAAQTLEANRAQRLLDGAHLSSSTLSSSTDESSTDESSKNTSGAGARDQGDGAE